MSEVILSMAIISSEKANAPTYQACAGQSPWLAELTMHACSALSLELNTASPNKARVSSS